MFLLTPAHGRLKTEVSWQFGNNGDLSLCVQNWWLFKVMDLCLTSTWTQLPDNLSGVPKHKFLCSYKTRAGTVINLSAISLVWFTRISGSTAPLDRQLGWELWAQSLLGAGVHVCDAPQRACPLQLGKGGADSSWRAMEEEFTEGQKAFFPQASSLSPLCFHPVERL